LPGGLSTCLLVASGVWIGIGQPVQAAELAVVAAGSEQAAALIQALQDFKPVEHNLRVIEADPAAGNGLALPLEGADAAVVAGASLAVAARTVTATPLLAVMVTADQLEPLRRAAVPPAIPSPRHTEALLLEQPLTRQLRLILNLLPQTRRIGVVLGPETRALEPALKAATLSEGLQLVSATVQDEAGRADVLLVLPDPLVFNRTTARSVLLTAYRGRRPVFAYSEAAVKAGALAAVFSGPEQIADETWDWFAALEGKARTGPLRTRVPTHFDVTINPQVARSLNLDLPDAPSVRNALGTAEGGERP